MINIINKIINTSPYIGAFLFTKHEMKPDVLPLSNKEKFNNAIKFCQDILDCSGDEVSVSKYIRDCQVKCVN